MPGAIHTPQPATGDERALLHALFKHALAGSVRRVQTVTGQAVVPDMPFALPVRAGHPEAPDTRPVESGVASLERYRNPLQPAAEPLCTEIGRLLTERVVAWRADHAQRQVDFEALCRYFAELQELQEQLAGIVEREWARWGGADRPKPDPLIGSVEHAPHWLIAGLQGRDTDATREELQQQTELVRNHVLQGVEASSRRLLARLRVNAALRWVKDAVHRKAEAIIDQVLALRQSSEDGDRRELVSRMEQLARADEVAHGFASDALKELDAYWRSVRGFWHDAPVLYAEKCWALLGHK